MTITYNGTTYDLTKAQLEGLRQSAMNPSGAFSMERRNEAADAKLTAMGILVEDYCYRDPEERRVKLDSIRLDLQRALEFTTTAMDLTAAEDRARDAAMELGHLNRMRHYLTEVAYGIVLQQFPQTLVFLPGQFRHLLPADYQTYYGTKA